jgi:hypothetical protein
LIIALYIIITYLLILIYYNLNYITANKMKISNSNIEANDLSGRNVQFVVNTSLQILI